MKAPLLIVVAAIILFGGYSVYVLMDYQSFFNRHSPSSSKIETSITPVPTDEDQSSKILSDISGVATCMQNGVNACKVTMIAGNYAKGTMAFAYWIAQNLNGKWKIVVEGNGIPSCEKIDKYSIPKEVFGNCLETSGNLRYK